MGENEEVVEPTTETENTDTQSVEEKEVEVQEVLETPEKKQEERTFTQEEVDRFVKKRLAKQEESLKDEYEQKYSRVKNVLNAGMGTEDFDEAVDKLAEFYKSKGVEIPTQPKLTSRQERILAEAEANDIIEQGYDAIVEKVDKLANKNNLTHKEKLIFKQLADERVNQESIKDLKSIGVGKEVLQDKEFKDFVSKLNPNLSLKEKYAMYEKIKPKKKVETLGSMKTTNSSDSGIKDFYTVEEAKKLTKEDYDRNPKLVDIVERSMLKWKY